MRLVLRDSRPGERTVHLGPGDPPRIPVGDHHGATAGEKPPEHRRALRQRIFADHQRLGIGGAGKRDLNFAAHNLSLLRVVRRRARPLAPADRRGSAETQAANARRTPVRNIRPPFRTIRTAKVNIIFATTNICNIKRKNKQYYIFPFTINLSNTFFRTDPLTYTIHNL